MTESPRTYTATQIADILQIDVRTVRTKARAGTWPYLAFGPKTMRFTESHLDTILTTSEAAPPAQRQTRTRRRRP